MPNRRDPDAPTRDLGRAFVVAARIAALPLHLHEATVASACGSDHELAQQVRSLLRTPGATTAPGRPADAPPDDESFGRYLLHERLGEGSMGVVYRATQTDTGRTVAVKRLHPGAASDAMLQRFHREIVLLARLQHRGIVQILDAGHVLTEHGREPFLAMELVDGPGLLAGADQARLDRRARVQLLVQLCRAIAYAHRRGVIHRDLKPDNVRLELDRGVLLPRILDFGVATASGAHTAEATLAHNVVGTLGYIAPEQIDGEVDARCDVYSLGAIGYQLLTGHRPVDLRGLGVLAAIARIRDQDPLPASQFDAALRGDLDAVLAKALARSPDDRYAGADELGDELERWLQSRPVEARRATPFYVLSRFVRRQRAMSAGVAVAVATLAIGLQFTLFAIAEARDAKTSLENVLASTAAELSASSSGHVRPRELPEHLKRAVSQFVARFPDDAGALQVQAEFLQMEGQFARSEGQTQLATELRRRLITLRQRIDTLQSSPESRHALALAHVLLGDLHKERSEDDRKDFAAARACYLHAHPLFLALRAAAPTDRRTRDDLGHSHLRLAALDLKEGLLDRAEGHLVLAEQLVDGLTHDHGANSNTHSLLRDLAGLCGHLASLRGDETAAMLCAERMLHHIATAHRMAPDNLHVAEFLLATSRSAAEASHRRGQSALAREQLQLAQQMAELFSDRDPTNVHALDERSAVARLQATFALETGQFAECFRHLTFATTLALAMQKADDYTRLHARLSEIHGVTNQTLARIEGLRGVARAEALDACRPLLPAIASASTLLPLDRELRILLARLQVAAGSREDSHLAEQTLAEARRDGWFDPRLWFLTVTLLERGGEVAAALADLATPPQGLPDDLRQAAELMRSRLQNR